MKQARLTDGDWTVPTTESQSAPAQSSAEQTGEKHPETKAALCEQAAIHAGNVAAEHFPELPVKAIGWEQFSRVVRHELIHAWQYHEYNEADHGSTFKQWVESLETDRHCEQYTEPNYWVVCEECESRDPRYRRSKVVKEPGKYSCGRCGGAISIEYV